MEFITIVDKLENNRDLTDEEFLSLITNDDPEVAAYLYEKAAAVRKKVYGKNVYIRGLIEFTNYCKNNCKYCGIRRDNKTLERYRLSENEILSCCDMGYELGFRTFVLQGGEDPYYTDDMIVSVIKEIKRRYPDTAVTLSIGEKNLSKTRKNSELPSTADNNHIHIDSYKRFYDAGADRYLLRHETADKKHYELLHPEEMSFEHRIDCLRRLKEIGYQVGCGMMIGSPGQKPEHLVRDLRFIQELQPEMVGIGPFIPHHETEYADCPHGSVDLTLRMLSIIRLILPEVLLPATTALGTVDAFGREKGLQAGANVLMPNLSPSGVRDKYLLYDNKICTGEEAAECIRCLSRRVSDAGYRIVTDRGDHAGFSLSKPRPYL